MAVTLPKLGNQSASATPELSDAACKAGHLNAVSLQVWLFVLTNPLL